MGRARKAPWRRLSMALWVAVLVSAWFGGWWLYSPSQPVAQTRPAGSECPCSFSELAKEVSPGVVNIRAVKAVKAGGASTQLRKGDPFYDFFEKFFGDRYPSPREFKQRAMGSGLILDREGFILTNNHVVEDTKEIQVTLSDGREFDAETVGLDPKTDLALIRIHASDLQPLPLGDADKLDVGDWVIAVGSPFGLGNTVTAGIVSAKYRRIGAGAYDSFIQTDASINPGNSGGPLLNTDGEVVGINTAIFSQSGGNIGIGFAVPVNMAKELLPQLKRGKVVRGWLGVGIQEITSAIKDKLSLSTDQGALVSDVTKGGPADKAGIRRGDVIVAFDGKPIQEMHDLPFMVATTDVGETVPVEIARKGERKTIQVKVGKMEEETDKAQAAQEVEPAPKLGLSLEEITPEIARKYGLPETSGLVVVAVSPGTPAAQAGLKPGDIIIEVDQQDVETMQGLKSMLRDYEKGDTILLLVNRKGNTLYTTLELG